MASIKYNMLLCYKHLLLKFVDDTHYVQRRESRFHFCVVFVQPLKKNIYIIASRLDSCFRKKPNAKTVYYLYRYT